MIPINSAAAGYERAIREVLESLPRWYVRAARVSRIEVSSAPEVRDQIAMYEHGSRRMRITPGVGKALLRRAISHELGHGCDDYLEQPHYFSGSDAWIKIHRIQSFFDHPKYAEQALEYFADMLSKVITQDVSRLAATNPYEVRFFTEWVIPTLQKEFE